MSGAIVAAIVTGLVGLILILLGYLIRAQSLATLIAGYDPTKVKDKKGLTNWVGANVIGIGTVICLYAVVTLLTQQQAGLPLHLGFTALLAGLTLRTVLGARRY